MSRIFEERLAAALAQTSEIAYILASYPVRSLLLIALGHLFIELCNNFLPVVYPELISTLGLNYSQVGVLALVAG